MEQFPRFSDPSKACFLFYDIQVLLYIWNWKLGKVAKFIVYLTSIKYFTNNKRWHIPVNFEHLCCKDLQISCMYRELPHFFQYFVVNNRCKSPLNITYANCLFCCLLCNYGTSKQVCSETSVLWREKWIHKYSFLR